MNRQLITILQKRWRSIAGSRREYTLLGSSAAILLLLLILALQSGDPDLPSDSPVTAAHDTLAQETAAEESQLIIRDELSAGAADHTQGEESRSENIIDMAPLPLVDAEPTDEQSTGIAPLPIASTGPAHIALIIDDLGNNAAAGERAIALPADITFAVLPHTPHGRSLAEAAHAAGKEVMLHAPMSNMGDLPLGPGGLTTELDQEAFERTLDESLFAVPHVAGVNNHTGSRLTALPEPMQWLMEMLNDRELYFVDSVTTAKTVAGDLADKNGVPNLRRQVFLDHDTDPAAIDREFRRLLEIAIRDGQAVGIGHPYPETLEYLEQILPLLPALDIHLVFVSTLL